MFIPVRREPIVFNKALSDASTLKNNISLLPGDLKSVSPSSSQIIKSADNISTMSSPGGSLTSISSDNSMKIRNDRIMSYKKSRVSQSTSDLNLNNRNLNLSVFGDVQLNDSQFFEVMYIGKIKVSHKKVPKTFIDDAIPKFIAHDKMKMKNLEAVAKQSENLAHQNLSDASASENETKSSSAREGDSGGDQSDSSCVSGEVKNSNVVKEDIIRSYSIEVKQRDRSASIGTIEQNRTMVFILGRTDIRLISPDRKQILLHKNFDTLVRIVQGVENPDHFGIICSEKNKLNEDKFDYIGYVFKCQSDTIAHDIIISVSKSLETLEEEKVKIENKNVIDDLMTCDHCPMIWYNRLCLSIEGMNDKKTYNTIMRYTEELNDEDHDIIIHKYFGSDKVNDFSLDERNKFLLALIEAHCQMRQQRHVHDTIENRSEFLNQYLGGSTIFMKAKRSLSNSFDHLLKRRGSKDCDTNNNVSIDTEYRKRAKPNRSMSLEENSSQGMTLRRESPERQKINTSKMDMFLKVGNTSKDNSNKIGSWRQNILKKVAVKEKGVIVDDESLKFLPTKTRKNYRSRQKRSATELRDLWKSAGKQIILLLRMEKENARLQEQQNEYEIRRMKLDYNDIISCDQKLTEVWESYINEASKSPSTDNRLFLQGIKSGVPRGKRGEVWMMLAQQYNKNHPMIDTTDFINYNTSYQDLLKNLTEHQHAIFIDIGRTFPNHEYYKTPFGLGQLSLFNILKAYSILDPEVGYCQGLAFICGVLLLHLSEEHTFNLLKHLMFQRQLRLNYLPSMKHFQMQLYQLSRLIKDNLPEIHELFDKNDVATTLYASSWMLTIFSSSFELGFVSKIYDLLLFASEEVIFRVILSLLHVHKEELLKLDCFEDIMNYLKNVIPKIDEVIMTKVFQNVYTLCITRQLMDYRIEYNVLMEEIQNTNHHVENLRISREENDGLQKQLQIAESNIKRLESIRQSQQQEIQSKGIQTQSLENTIRTLGDYLSSLSNTRKDIEIPTDIRRLLQQLEHQQKQQQMKRRPVFLDRKIGKSVSVNGLGMNLKVLVEQNENENSLLQTPPSAVTPTISTSPMSSPISITPTLTTPEILALSPSPSPGKKKYFEKAFEQIRQFEAGRTHSKLLTRDNASPEKPKLFEELAIEEEVEHETTESSTEHPLSGLKDVNFLFHKMQLKSHKPTQAGKQH